MLKARTTLAIATLAVVILLLAIAAGQVPIAARGPAIGPLRIVATEDRSWRGAIYASFSGVSFSRVGSEFGHRAALFIGTAHEVAFSPSFRQSGWLHAGPICGTILAVADNDVESPGSYFEIVSSDDGGATWYHLVSIPKPHYTAYFEELHCEGGVLTLRAVYDTEMTASYGWMYHLKNLVFRKPRGEVFVLWKSNDAGHTWRGPKMVPTTSH